MAFMEAIGKRAESSEEVFLTGGASALLLGFRDETIDIDLKLNSGAKEILETIAWLKERLRVNVDFSSPDQYIPALPGWRERSEFIGDFGLVQFFHYDFYGQALAKVLRGYKTDISDARALVEIGRVKKQTLREFFTAIKPELIRYPGINSGEFERKLERFLGESP